MHRSPLRRPLGKPHISPCSNASTGAAGKLEEIWGRLWREEEEKDMFWQFSKTDTLGRISRVKISDNGSQFSFEPALAGTFGWGITSASCFATFQPKWNGKLTKSAIHEIQFLRTPLHRGKKALLNICGKTSVFTRDFYPSSPLFISDSYLTHFISCYTRSWRLFWGQQINLVDKML